MRDVAFKDGWYGKNVATKNGVKFKPYGKITELVELCEDINSGAVYFKLCCSYLGKPKVRYVERTMITQPTTAEELAKIGYDVSRKSFDVFVDSILSQEDDMDASGIAPTPVYINLGWTELYDEDGSQKLFYRADTLVGAAEGKYIGNLDVRKHGSFELWRKMVREDVLGRPALELVLIAALAAVVNGLIAPVTNGENPIVHLNYASGRGKTSAGYLAVSVSGRSFEGSIEETDAEGITREYTSCLKTWGATDNAIIASQAGNSGVVVVLNELGKNFSSNLTRVCFDLSEGSDKQRLKKTLEQRISAGYHTVFISTGEESLIERCKAKLEGLAVRIFELREQLTDDADHANRLKETSRENCGHAGPMLAEYIIEKGGRDFVLPIYKKWLKQLKNVFPDTLNKDRFVEKFAALFVTTAEIAIEALDIKFDRNRLINFLLKHEEEQGDERNVAARSYDLLLEQCRSNEQKFYFCDDITNVGKKTSGLIKTPLGEVWGRINDVKKILPDGKVVIQEIAIYKNVAEKILAEHGYHSVPTCIAAWKEKGVLDVSDETHPCKRLKVDPMAPVGAKSPVYVLRVYCDPDDQAGYLAEHEREQKDQVERKSKLVAMETRHMLASQKNLLSQGGDEDNVLDPT